MRRPRARRGCAGERGANPLAAFPMRLMDKGRAAGLRCARGQDGRHAFRRWRPRDTGEAYYLLPDSVA